METSTREYGSWKEIEIDGIKALARRQKDAPSFAKWEIVEAQTKLSLMPPSWPGGLSAGTLEGAKHIVQTEVIDRQGKEKILQRIKEVVAKSSPAIKEPWEGKHKGYVKDNTYFNLAGEPIHIGNKITMSFAGSPSDMPRPWKLIKAENYQSSVDYANHVRITVEASNGKQMTFDHAEYYSPHPIESTNIRKEAKTRTSETFVQTGLGRKLDNARLAHNVLPRTKAELAKHKKHPNRYDIKGIDTPKRSKTSGMR